MTTYFNEFDPFAAQWLRNLYPHATVDSRTIHDVQASDLVGFEQCHFFGGIGGWQYALDLAGWHEGREVWTGSCPCQPFSIAGKRQGESDERHLWPEMFRLISQRRPATVFGEQVASSDGFEWLSRVRLDLESQGYAVGCASLCAAGTAAPHLRQRIFFVANADCKRRYGKHSLLWEKESGRNSSDLPETARHGTPSVVADTNSDERFWWSGPLQVGWNTIKGKVERGGRQYDAQWRIKPGISMLAYGVSARVAKLRSIGNAIVPQLGAKFIRAFMEAAR